MTSGSKYFIRAAAATRARSRRNKTRDRKGRRLAGVEAAVTVDETETDTRGVGGVVFPGALEKTLNVDAL